jgi:prepilin-type N-terminal cleavage/methylation domain-containing protein
MRRGFTLAEVLITLGIIGVVAALTIPNIVRKVQNRALHIAFKKYYSVLSNAINTMNYERGEVAKSADLESANLYYELRQYLNVSKDCGMQSCLSFAQLIQTYKTYNNANINASLLDNGQLILNDGSFLMFENTAATYPFISVDTNGYKKLPNKLGHDVFTFQYLSDGRLVPMGAPNTLYTDLNVYCSKTSTHVYNGVACAYPALVDEKNYWANLP